MYILQVKCQVVYIEMGHYIAKSYYFCMTPIDHLLSFRLGISLDILQIHMQTVGQEYIHLHEYKCVLAIFLQDLHKQTTNSVLTVLSGHADILRIIKASILILSIRYTKKDLNVPVTILNLQYGTHVNAE